MHIIQHYLHHNLIINKINNFKINNNYKNLSNILQIKKQKYNMAKNINKKKINKINNNNSSMKMKIIN